MAAKSDTKSESKTEPKSEKAQAARDKNLELALQAIAKEYGEGSIMRLGDAHSKLNVEVIPTGSIAIDTALGVGGFPRGRIIEIFGPESSGKTTLTLTVIAQAQRAGRRGGLHRRRARARSLLRAQARREHERTARLPARLGRRSADHCRDADQVERGRRRRARFGRGADHQGGTRRPDGRRHRGRTGAADEPGHAQADLLHQQVEDLRDFHQPDPRKNRRDVRQSRNDAGRQGARSFIPRSASTSGASRRSRRPTAPCSATAPGSRS